MMKTFVRRPRETAAVQLRWSQWNEVCELLGDALTRHNPDGASTTDAAAAADTCGEPGPDYLTLTVLTANGHQVPVRHGDWIIPDSEPGTFYPCDPTVFAKDYMEAGAAAPADPPAGDEERLNAVYRERNRLVAALTTRWPSVVTEATDAPGWWVVYIQTPEGQLSWHYPPADADLFAGVQRVETWEYDGHDTAEKYNRLARAAATDAREAVAT